MMRFRVLLLAALVLACVAQLQAGPQPAADPRVIVNNTHFLDDSCTPIDSLSFTFFANSSGGGTSCFINMSSEDWTFLQIDTPSPNPSDVITCGGDLFASCLVLQQSGNFIVDFSGSPGIQIGEQFEIDLGASGWPVDGKFEAFANPEPATLGLFLGGLLPLVVRRVRNFAALKRQSQAPLLRD